MYREAKNSSFAAQNVNRTGYRKRKRIKHCYNPTLYTLDNIYPHVVEPHDRVGGEVSDLMAGLTVNERAVHLNPMTTDVQDYKQLEPEHVLRVKDTQHHDKTHGSTSARR